MRRMERMLEQLQLHQELLIGFAPVLSRRNSKGFFRIGIETSSRPRDLRALYRTSALLRVNLLMSQLANGLCR